MGITKPPIWEWFIPTTYGDDWGMVFDFYIHISNYVVLSCVDCWDILYGQVQSNYGETWSVAAWNQHRKSSYYQKVQR